MNTRPWHFLINTFLVVTRINYKKALVLGADHLAKLIANQADPVIAAMVAPFDAVWQSFKATDVNLRIALGYYKGETKTVEQLFDILNKEHLPDWEPAIYVVYRKGTPAATALLPQGRKPFQLGTYESRIQEIDALGQKCAAIPALQPLSVIILAFHVQIESARQLQQSTGEGQVAALRTLRETARVSLCQALYGNLGLLMNHYQSNPIEVANYFEMPLLRRKSDDGSDETVLTFLITDAVTGAVIIGATVTVTLATGEVLTGQTDLNGRVEFTIERLPQTVQATLEVSAEGYETRTESGPIEPGDDVDADIALTPTPPAPPVP